MKCQGQIEAYRYANLAIPPLDNTISSLIESKGDHAPFLAAMMKE
jgi:hypothetical protein